MLYFKNVELAKKYHVSLGTVRNWIEAAQAGKLELRLITEGEKAYIANTTKNITTIAKTVESGRKYRNKIAAKSVVPKADFYALFDEEQIHDIISNLEIHHEIPRQYNYFDGGAKRWEEFAERLAAEEAPNMLTGGLHLMNLNMGYIDSILKEYSRVNIVDVGVGNGYPAKPLLTRSLKSGKLGRYIALDISKPMLEIAKNNIEKWFDGAVRFEGHPYNVNYDRFSHLLTPEYLHDYTGKTANIVLLLGGTLSNMRYPENGLRMIHDSMGIDDLLIYTNKLDTQASREYFDFNFESGNTSLSPAHRLIFDLLNIDESFYDIEMGYNPSAQQRYIRVRLRVAIKIQFTFQEGTKEVSFNKGDTILLWRFIHQTARDLAKQFEENDFYTFHSSQTADDEYILTISRVRKEHPASKFLSITDTYPPR